MYPHERSLVTKMADKSFALLGVNTDSNREALKKTLVDEKLTWRSFWDNGAAPGAGPICGQWKIRSFPTLVLIDQKGKIRNKGPELRDPAKLDKLIEDLLKEAPSEE